MRTCKECLCYDATAIQAVDGAAPRGFCRFRTPHPDPNWEGDGGVPSLWPVVYGDTDWCIEGFIAIDRRPRMPRHYANRNRR